MIAYKNPSTFPPYFYYQKEKLVKKKRLTEVKSRIVYWIKFQKWEQEKQVHCGLYSGYRIHLLFRCCSKGIF